MDSQRTRGLPVSGVVDVTSVREEALGHFNKINWNDYVGKDIFKITQEDVERFHQVETLMGRSSVTEEDVDSFLADNGEKLFSAFMAVVEHVTEPNVLRYVLARLEGLVPDSIDCRDRVASLVGKTKPDLSPLLRVVKAGHGYSEHAASHVMAKLLSVNMDEAQMTEFVQWTISSLKLGSSAELLSDAARVASARAAINALMSLFVNEKARKFFIKMNGLPLLAILLKNSEGRAQLCYEICFLLWTLTLCSQAIPHFGTSGAVAAIIDQVIAAQREKIVRVALGALINLLGKHEGVYNERMIEAGLIKTLTTMRERKWTDSELVNDIQTVREALLKDFKNLTTMERYEKELRSGALEWGLLHTDKFWKDNYMAFEKKEFELIVMLIELLQSGNATTVAVALYDLGDFVRFYPNGKQIVKRLGGKKVVMSLLTSPEPEVQKQALQCMSKIMVNNWEFIK